MPLTLVSPESEAHRANRTASPALHSPGAVSPAASGIPLTPEVGLGHACQRVIESGTPQRAATPPPLPSRPAPLRYFHGGVRRLRVGDRILPPKNTGAPSLADFGGAGVTRRDRIYLTTDPEQASLYALMHAPRGRGWVYEVAPLGDIELDPDYLGPEGESVCVAAGRVVRIVERDVIRWQGFTAAQATRILLTPDGDEHCATTRFRVLSS